MTPEQKDRIREVFLAACEKTPDQRLAFVRRVCHGDEIVCREVESLLASDDEAGTFLASPAPGRSFAKVDPAAIVGSSRGAGPVVRPVDVDLDRVMTAAHPERIGPFRILDVLGHGGMGVVYRVEQDNPRRIVALKVIRSGVESPETLKRFQHESQVLGWLQHPGIAQIYQAGTADTGSGPQAYFAMELVRGDRLTDYADSHELTVRERLELVAQICEAIHHAHQKGVIHRDLKPANILVNEDGQPKVLDFGVARVTDVDVRATTPATAAGHFIGTLAYMSPEQMTGDARALDTRSDIYSLGVVLYELLTGRLPIDVTVKSLPQAVRAIAEDDPAPLRTASRSLRGDIETIIGKALEKDRDRRYASAAALADDLRRFLSDQPIAARPATTMYQLRKFARRNRALVGVVAVAFVALSCALAYTTFERERAVRAEKDARHLQELAEDRLEMAESRAYAANIAAAHAALRANDVRTSRQLLETAPVAARNVEWNYLRARLDTSLMTLSEHQSWVRGVAYSPDGTRLASASNDGTVRIWDAATGERLHVFLSGGPELRSVAFSGNGRLVAAGTAHGRVIIWDVGQGTQLATLHGHKADVVGVAFSPDERRIATAAFDGTARIWDVETRRQRRVLKHPGRLFTVVWCPEGTRLVTSCQDNVARIWDVSDDGSGSSTARTAARGTSQPSGRGDGQAALEVRVLPRGPRWDFIHGWAAVLSPDGATLVTGDHIGLIKLWDSRTGELRRTLAGHDSRIRALAFRRDGKELVSACDDGIVRNWDPDLGIEITSLRGHEDTVFGLAFSPDGSRVASSSRDGSIRIWDPRASAQLARLGEHRNSGIRRVHISPDGSRIVSGGEDNMVRLWDAESGAGIATLRGHQGMVMTAMFSPEGDLIASGSYDHTIRLWDAWTGKEVAVLTGHQWFVCALAFRADGASLVSASRDGTLKVWDLATRSETMTLELNEQEMTAVAWSPDGCVIAAGTEDGAVAFWNAVDGQRLAQSLAHRRAVIDVSFSPDGRRLVSAAYDGTLTLWNAETFTPIKPLDGHTEAVTEAVYSPDGSRIASVSHDRTLRIWDAASGETMLSFRAHQDWVFSVAFSPDGTWLATSAKSIRLWETCPPTADLLQLRQARVKAESLIDHLQATLPTLTDVVAHVEQDADLAADVQRLALQTARLRLSDR